MSDEKVITQEIAERFLADEDSVELSEFTAIEDDAAESLSKHEGDLTLSGYLSGLTSLSDAAAESLSKHKGDLNLSGLTSLSDAAAQSLDLRGLSDAAAESLSKHKGDLNIYLDEIPESAAKILRNHPSFAVEEDRYLLPTTGSSLTVPVNDPMGEESYQCCECGGAFEVDWRDGTVTHNASEEQE